LNINVNVNVKAVNPTVGPKYYKLISGRVTLAVIKLSMRSQTAFTVSYLLPGIDDDSGLTSVDAATSLAKLKIQQWLGNADLVPADVNTTLKLGVENLFTGMSGCSDHNCVIEKPTGMGTNGGCNCLTNMSRGQLKQLQSRINHLKSLIKS